LQTDVLEHWRTGVIVRGKQIAVSSNVAPPRAALQR
jgi:hypothetical protein